MSRAGPVATLITALLANDPDDRLPAPRVRVWLRWSVDVARPAPFPEVLPEQSRAAGSRSHRVLRLPCATLERPCAE